MSKASKLVKKMEGLNKKVKRSPLKKRFDKVFKLEEVMQTSPGVYKLVTAIQRRFDKVMGVDVVAQEPAIAFRTLADVERFDFDLGAGEDFGIKLTLAAGVIAASKVAVGDFIFFEEGELAGRSLQVVALESATELRLDDVATYVGPEVDASVVMQISAAQ